MKPPAVPLEKLKEQFERMFPDSFSHDPGSTVPQTVRELPSSDRREIMRAAIRHALDPHHPWTKSQFEVSTLCFNVGIRSIFCINRSENRRQRAHWRRLIYDANLRCALGALEIRSEMNIMASILKKAVLWCPLLGAITTALFSVGVEDRVTGNFEARQVQRREVAAPLAGFVRSVYVDEGDHVDAGTVIAVLDMPELDSQIAQSRTRVDEARANLMLLASGARPEELAGQRNRVQQIRAWRDAAPIGS